MELSEEDQTVLHYAMLEYLFKRQALSSSCYNGVWVEFKSENQEFNQLSAGETISNDVSNLKLTIF